MKTPGIDEPGVCWSVGCTRPTPGTGYCAECAASIEASRDEHGMPAPEFISIQIPTERPICPESHMRSVDD